MDVDLQPGTLWRVALPWHAGDELVLDLPVPVRTSRPHPRIDAARGCVAFERGPLVYCLEEVDAGSPERVESVPLRRTGSAPPPMARMCFRN